MEFDFILNFPTALNCGSTSEQTQPSIRATVKHYRHYNEVYNQVELKACLIDTGCVFEYRAIKACKLAALFYGSAICFSSSLL